MASRVIVPFDFNPVSTTRKVSSYTIPAGKYAYVEPSYYDLTLNGSSVCIGSSKTLFSGVTITASNSFIIGSMSGIISVSRSGAGNYVFCYNGAEVGLGSSSGMTAIIYNNSLISVTTSGGAVTWNFSTTKNSVGSYITATTGANYSVSVQPFTMNSFWVPTGTVLNGTDYLVTEYNALS